MLHDRRRVVRPDPHAGGGLGGRVQRPGLVDRGARDAAELGDPAPDVVAVGIEAPTLEDRVEDPEVGLRVRARARGPLPAAVVGGDVAVHEVAHELGLAQAPVQQEVLGQERGRDHPRPVVHEPRRAQLAHRGVDDRVAGPALAPGLEGVRVVAPRQVGEGRLERLAEDARVVPQDVGIELPPGDLGHEDPAAVARRPPPGPRPRPARAGPSAGPARAATSRPGPSGRGFRVGVHAGATHAARRARAAGSPGSGTSAGSAVGAPRSGISSGRAPGGPGIRAGAGRTARRGRASQARRNGAVDGVRPAVLREHLVRLVDIEAAPRVDRDAAAASRSATARSRARPYGVASRVRNRSLAPVSRARPAARPRAGRAGSAAPRRAPRAMPTARPGSRA